MIETIILTISGLIIIWRWDLLQSRVRKLEREKHLAAEVSVQVLKSAMKIKTLETMLRNVRALQVKQRERTPAKPSTLRNRELMKIGRKLEAGKFDAQVTKPSDD